MFGFVSSAGAAGAKIGFVDIQKAISGTQEFKKSQMKFNLELEKAKGDIAARKKKVEGMLRELNQQGFVLSPELKKQKLEQFQKAKKKFDRYVQDQDEEFNKQRKQSIEKISKKMLKVLQKVGKSKNFTMILEKKALFYSDSSYDLTDLVIKIYNKTYK